MLGYTVHMVSDPDAIGRVLPENKANDERPAVVRRLLSAALGRGLLNAEGNLWREQRHIVAPTFAPNAVAGFADAIAAAATRRATRWPSGRRRIGMAEEGAATTAGIVTSKSPHTLGQSPNARLVATEPVQ